MQEAPLHRDDVTQGVSQLQLTAANSNTVDLSLLLWSCRFFSLVFVSTPTTSHHVVGPGPVATEDQGACQSCWQPRVVVCSAGAVLKVFPLPVECSAGSVG